MELNIERRPCRCKSQTVIYDKFRCRKINLYTLNFSKYAGSQFEIYFLYKSMKRRPKDRDKNLNLSKIFKIFFFFYIPTKVLGRKTKKLSNVKLKYCPVFIIRSILKSKETKGMRIVQNLCESYTVFNTHNEKMLEYF